MVYTLRFFSLKCSLFHNSNLFGFCIIHILYTECAKIKKNNSGAKKLMKQWSTSIKHYTNKADHTHVVLHTVMEYAINKKKSITYLNYLI